MRSVPLLERIADVLDTSQAMSHENMEIVKRFEDSWAAGDLDATLECIHDEVVFDWSDSIGPFAGIYEGPDGMVRFWQELRDAFEEFRPEALELVEAGPESVITLDVVRGRGKGSGIEIEAQGAMLWSFRDGKIAHAKMFQTKEEALQAAGLSA
jgi:ketosteroid isomerase-like protein